jgi:hypothetical protein
MPTEPKSKKPASSATESQSDALPNPDGFLAELDDWGAKPNPASFEKLLETYQDKFARALSQGYSADDICRLAASYGIQVKPSTFRKYWQKLHAKPSNESTPAATSKPPATKPSTKPDSTASTTANSAVNF